MANTAPALPTNQHHRPLVSVLITIAASALLMTVGGALGADRLPEPVGHGLSHLFVAAPLGWLLTSMLWRWPAPRVTAPGRLGRRLSVVGLSGVVTGQLLEVLGARVDEPTAAAFEEIAHTSGMVVTNLSMLVVIVGTVLALTAATRDGSVPRWVTAIVVALILAAFAMMVVGEPGT